MDAHLIEFLGMLVRWLHVIAGIAWIGGRAVDRRGAGEFMTGLGLQVGVAFGLRQAARALIKLLAGAGGAVVSAAVAFTGTSAIGSAASAYYIRGVSLADARRVFRRGKPDAKPDSKK